MSIGQAWSVSPVAMTYMRGQPEETQQAIEANLQHEQTFEQEVQPLRSRPAFHCRLHEALVVHTERDPALSPRLALSLHAVNHRVPLQEVNGFVRIGRAAFPVIVETVLREPTTPGVFRLLSSIGVHSGRPPGICSKSK